MQPRNQSLHCGGVARGDGVVAFLRAARHCVFHRPEFAPGHLRFFKGVANRAPVGLSGRGRGWSAFRGSGEKLRCGLRQRLHDLFAFGEVFAAFGLELFQIEHNLNRPVVVRAEVHERICRKLGPADRTFEKSDVSHGI